MQDRSLGRHNANAEIIKRDPITTHKAFLAKLQNKDRDQIVTKRSQNPFFTIPKRTCNAKAKAIKCDRTFIHEYFLSNSCLRKNLALVPLYMLADLTCSTVKLKARTQNKNIQNNFMEQFLRSSRSLVNTEVPVGVSLWQGCGANWELT